MKLLQILSQTFLDQGDEVIVSDPTFSEYELNALIEGAVVGIMQNAVKKPARRILKPCFQK